MRQSVILATVLCLVMMLSPAFGAEAPTPIMDVVTLKDGSVIYGEVVEMEEGLLLIHNPSARDLIKIKWTEVSMLRVTHPLPFHLKEGTVLIGTVEEGKPGFLGFKAEPMQGTLAVPMDSVVSVNPIIQRPVIYVGSLTGGFSQTTGNSHLRNASLLGELVARKAVLLVCLGLL